MKKKIYWILVNGGFMALAIGGLVYEIEGMKNVLFFCVWPLLLITILMSLIVGAVNKYDELKEVLKKTKNIEFAFPRWFDVSYDLIMVGIFAFYGHFIVGAAYALHIVFGAIYHEGIKKIKAEPEQQESEK